MAICLSYFRRILAIGPHPVWCTPGEIFLHADIHHQYIVQLRALLSVIPGICSDLRRAYHDDWLVDIIHIIYYVLHIYDAKDMFLVYKSGGVIKEFHTLLEDDGVEDEKEPSRPPTATQPGSQSLDGDHKSTSSRSVHVPNNLKELYSQKTLTKGLLSDKLRSERQSRSQVASVQPRFGRFAATYRQPMVVSSQASSQDAPLASSAAGIVAFDAANPTATNPSNPADPASGEPTLPTGPPNTSSVSNDCVILRDVFGQRGDAVPQAKLKRNKRHMAFVQGNPYLSSIHTQVSDTTPKTFILRPDAVLSV